MPAPSQVYLTGMAPVLPKELLVIEIEGVVGAVGLVGGGPSSAGGWNTSQEVANSNSTAAATSLIEFRDLTMKNYP